jgi:hypothetical protein
MDYMEVGINFVPFEEYRRRGGALTREEHDAVISYVPEESKIISASLYLTYISPVAMELVDNRDKLVIARLIGAVVDKAPPDEPYRLSWFLTQAYFLQGKDPNPIYLALGIQI